MARPGRAGAWPRSIIFAETGLLIGFFLPGDSLLFIAGFLASKPKGLPHLPSLGLVVPVLVVSAFAGNQVGYIFGDASARRCSIGLTRGCYQRNVVRTHEFFERHGTKALVMASFVPIVRTFVPMVAGVGKMKHPNVHRRGT